MDKVAQCYEYESVNCIIDHGLYCTQKFKKLQMKYM